MMATVATAMTTTTTGTAMTTDGRHAFRAMGTEVLVLAGGDALAARAAGIVVERLFRAHEAALSRFRSDSELSALNAAAGRPFAAGAVLRAATAAALEAAADTDGLVDPTLLGAVAAAGYDRSFDEMDRDAPALQAPPPTGTGWRAVRVEDPPGTVTIPAGVGLDLGGTAKGWTVDRAVARLSALPDLAIDAGGDLWAAGTASGGEPWTVAVADPHAGGDLATVTVQGEAVATSSVTRRSWRGGHHLIDPRDGLPSSSDVAQATVVAASVLRAETLAKAALLLGSQRGLALLEQRGVDGLLVTRGGDLVATRGFAARRLA